MRIAAIGGAGFAGYHLVANLLARGHEVLVYDNLFAGRAEADLPWLGQVEFARADILDADRLRGALDSFAPAAIYHLAAIHFIPYCDREPAQTMRVNVEGTLNVMLAAAATPSVKAVVFASSVAVYSTTSDWHHEAEAPDPSDIYGLSKLLGERVVRQYAAAAGISAINARLTNLYGPEETNPHVIPAILKQLREGAATIKLGRTDTFRDFLYAGDCAEALARLLPVALASEMREEVNLATGKEASVSEVLRTLLEESGRDVKVEFDESRVRKVDRLHLRADVSKLQKMLQWLPATPLREGMRRTVEHELRRAEAVGR